MIESANQLKKYKKLLKKLEKDFPKGKAGYTGFTINVSYGGNKEPDLKRVIVNSSTDTKLQGTLLETLIESIKNQIDFWQRIVLQDIKQLEESLK